MKKRLPMTTMENQSGEDGLVGAHAVMLIKYILVVSNLVAKSDKLLGHFHLKGLCL